MDMREQKFGIEIEMTGITRQRAAEVMAAYFSSAASYDGRKKAAVMRGVSTR